MNDVVRSSGRTGNRTKTAAAIRAALKKVEASGRRISIKAVAEEAGVDPSLIHHSYAELAETIRAAAGRTTRKQRDDSRARLAQARIEIAQLKDDVDMLLAELAEAASVNLSLADEVELLRAAVSAENVYPLRKL